MIVDDDPGLRDSCYWALRSAGFRVSTAATGGEALAQAKQAQVDFMLVDLRLPDMLGTDLIRGLPAGVRAPFALISGFLSVATTVEAMKLGAVDVVEKPVDVEDVLALVEAVMDDAPPAPVRGLSDRAAVSTLPRPGSVAERWATYVLAACGAEGDIRTLRDWAMCAGVSYTGLRECCGLVDIVPHQARDFARIFRAVWRSSLDETPLEALMDVGDQRTLDSLLARAGLDEPGSPTLTVDLYLELQKFVALDNPGLRALRRLLDAGRR